MAIVGACPVPLGIPVPLIHDLLTRSVPASAILAPEGSLLAQYRAARGYACPWGDIIEERAATSLVWHFLPVALWEETEPLRSPSHSAVELIPLLQPTLAATLRDRLPTELLLTGCHPHSRRRPHVLCSLLLVESAHEQRIRRWLATVFLPGILPEALAVCRARVADICQASSMTDAWSPRVT